MGLCSKFKFSDDNQRPVLQEVLWRRSYDLNSSLYNWQIAWLIGVKLNGSKGMCKALILYKGGKHKVTLEMKLWWWCHTLMRMLSLQLFPLDSSILSLLWKWLVKVLELVFENDMRNPVLGNTFKFFGSRRWQPLSEGRVLIRLSECVAISSCAASVQNRCFSSELCSVSVTHTDIANKFASVEILNVVSH